MAQVGQYSTDNVSAALRLLKKELGESGNLTSSGDKTLFTVRNVDPSNTNLVDRIVTAAWGNNTPALSMLVDTTNNSITFVSGKADLRALLSTGLQILERDIPDLTAKINASVATEFRTPLLFTPSAPPPAPMPEVHRGAAPSGDPYVKQMPPAR